MDKLKVLIIEDVKVRQNLIKEKTDIPDADCTQYADEALELLKTHDYDLIFLDHDLIGAKSGSYLTENWYKNKEEIKTIKPVIIIHSMNMEGATKMENYLKGISKVTSRIPFREIVLGEVDLKERVQQLINLTA
jgi:CheY-like chemotaxis protein